MSKGTVSLSSPLEDCEVGVAKEITLMVTPTANDATTGFTADVDEVVDYAEDEKEADGAKPYPAKDKSTPAVAIVISSGKKK